MSIFSIQAIAKIINFFFRRPISVRDWSPYLLLPHLVRETPQLQVPTPINHVFGPSEGRILIETFVFQNKLVFDQNLKTCLIREIADTIMQPAPVCSAFGSKGLPEERMHNTTPIILPPADITRPFMQLIQWFSLLLNPFNASAAQFGTQFNKQA